MSNNILNITGDKAVLKLHEALVASNVDKYRIELKDSIDNGVKNITIDISEISVIDSMGIGLLISIQNTLLKVGGKLEVINISADILDLFKSLRLDQHISLKGE